MIALINSPFLINSSYELTLSIFPTKVRAKMKAALLFEARAYHETEAFEGTRWSLVFYSWREAHQDARAAGGAAAAAAAAGAADDRERAPPPARAAFRTAAQAAAEDPARARRDL